MLYVYVDIPWLNWVLSLQHGSQIHSFVLNLGSSLYGLYRKQGVGSFNQASFKGPQKHKGQANPVGKA